MPQQRRKMPLKTNTRFDALKSSSPEKSNRFTNNRRRNYTPKYRNNRRTNSKRSYVPPHMRNKRNSALKIEKKPTFSLSNEQFPDLGGNKVVQNELHEEIQDISFKEKVQIEIPEEEKVKKTNNNGMLELNKEIYLKMLDDIEENKKYFRYTKVQKRNLDSLFTRKKVEWEELDEMDYNVRPFNFKDFYGITDDIPSDDENSDNDDSNDDDSDYDDDYYYY